MLYSFLPYWPTVYIFIFYCFVRNYHKLVVKKNSHLFSQSPAGCEQVLCLGFHRAEINMAPWLSSLLEALGKNMLSSSFRLLADFTSLWTTYLHTAGWRSLSAARGCAQVLASWSSPSFELTVENLLSCGIPPMLQISPISVSDL